jgi:hypothetical protein
MASCRQMPSKEHSAALPQLKMGDGELKMASVKTSSQENNKWNVSSQVSFVRLVLTGALFDSRFALHALSNNDAAGDLLLLGDSIWLNFISACTCLRLPR